MRRTNSQTTSANVSTFTGPFDSLDTTRWAQLSAANQSATTRVGSFKCQQCTTVGNGIVTAIPGGSPIAGATVTPGSRSTNTEANGQYSFNVPACTYPDMTAGFPCRTTATASTIVVSDGGTTTKDFSLANAATSGCLKDTSGGGRGLHADFTPTDSVNYNAASAEVSINVLSAVLSVSMIADQNPAPVGLNFNHKATITKTGDAPSANTVLTDVLPAQVTFTAASSPQGTCAYNSANRTVACNVGSIPASGSVTVQMTVTPREEGTLNDTATMTPMWPGIAEQSRAA